MRIIIINASPRINGLTATILHNIEAKLMQKNADIEYYDLCRLSMSQCKGCCICYKTGHCVINDDAEKLSEKIKKADGVILGSPTYAGNVSGYMKLMIDRGHFVIEQLLKDKYCVSVATGENYGSMKTSRILNDLILYSGGYISDSVIIDAPFNDIDPVLKKTDRLSSRSADRMYRAILKHKIYPLQEIFHRIIFFVGIKPFVLKKGKDYDGVTNRWQDLGINVH